MVTRDLLRNLEGRGVRLLVEGGRLIARGPSGSLTPELSALIREHRDTLLQELTGEASQAVTALPEPLVRLVRAAGVNALNRSAVLPSGLVTDLGMYVLTCAAYYSAGLDPEKQVRDLWAAHGAWAH